eukprot:3519853-Karenia_brevis.AAC.1
MEEGGGLSKEEKLEIRNWLAEEREQCKRECEEDKGGKRRKKDEDEMEEFAKDAHEEDYLQDVVPSSSSTNVNR